MTWTYYRLPQETWDKKRCEKMVESTVAPGLLLETPDLVQAVESGASQARCLEIINDNF